MTEDEKLLLRIALAFYQDRGAVGEEERDEVEALLEKVRAL